MGERIEITAIQIIQNGLIQMDIFYTEQKKGDRIFCNPDIFFEMIGKSMHDNWSAWCKENER